MPRDPYRLPQLVDPVRDWREKAACRGEDPALWHPETRGAPLTPERVNSTGAIGICRTCPVRAKCEKAGEKESDGIWGGVFRSSSPTLRERLGRAVWVICDTCGNGFSAFHGARRCSKDCKKQADARRQAARKRGAA